MYNIILKNFNSSYSVIKLILPAGKATRTPLLSTIFTQYNFESANDFYEKFNDFTKFLSSDILLPVFLYLPDSNSINDNFLFYVKSPNSYFLLKKLLIFPSLNYNTSGSVSSIKLFINIKDLFKVAIIKSIFLSIIIPKFFTIYFNNIRIFFFSLKGQLKSIQGLVHNDFQFNAKNFSILLFI